MKYKFMGGGMARIPKLLLGVFAMTYMLMASEDIKLPKDAYFIQRNVAAWYDKYQGYGGVHIFNMTRVVGTYDYDCEFITRVPPGGYYLDSWTQTVVTSHTKVRLNAVTNPTYSASGFSVDLKKGTLSFYAWYPYYGGASDSFSVSLFDN